MWTFILLVELFGGIPEPCTEQVNDMLLLGNDTLYVNIVFHQDSSIINFIDQEKLRDATFKHDDCWITSCYQQYFVVWKITERTIYLKEIVSCCSRLGLDMMSLFGDRYIPETGIKGSFVNEEMTAWNMPPIVSNIFFEENLKSVDVTIREGIISEENMTKLIGFSNE